ncbi:MAG: YihY/virulence factor BrkB family protein [Marmoricola sp.]
MTADTTTHQIPADPDEGSLDEVVRGGEPPVDDAAETDYDSTPKLGRRSGFYVLRKSVREFREDHAIDGAASLTFYAVLALFPAAIALLALLGVVGGAGAVDKLTGALGPLLPPSVLHDLQAPLAAIVGSTVAPLTLLVGVVAALWAASGYVGAFGRAMNRAYETEEGRAAWRLRPTNLFVTVVTAVLSAIAVAILAVSGPVADSVGSQLGLGDQALTVWGIAKWPVLAIVVLATVAVLYHFTPNVRLPFKVLSAGAFVAVLVWLVASFGVALYMVSFSSFDKVYGSLAGAVVVLLWLWVTNLGLLYGAELDAEVERARELHRGVPAEERIQAPPRSASRIERAEKRRARDVAKGRAIRESRAGSGNPLDRPF